MAYLPVNPEYRDPGFFKKKADIGLSNVDNMSAAEFVNAVSEDIKIIGNKKKASPKITTKGEFYGGILRTASRSSHAEFTLGLFDSVDPYKELASVHVDFAFSCVSEDELGHINYTIECPDNDIYLKDLYIVFSQIGDRLYVSLHSPSLPTRTSEVYFNIIGVNLIDWTEGTEKLVASKDISEIVKNHELARIRLTGPSSTVGNGAADSLSVYDSAGRNVYLDNISSLEDCDYPSINGVPFIGKKDLVVGNKEVGRHITIPAYHTDGSLEGAGFHNWEVLKDRERINVSKGDLDANPKETTKISNLEDYGYGLVRPSRYKILPQSSQTQSEIISWLDSLGEDTDVITVGAFKEYMGYLLKLITGETVDSYHLYLRNSGELFKTVPSSSYDFNLAVYSFLKNDSGKNNIDVTVETSEDWLHFENKETLNGICSLDFKVDPNQMSVDRDGEIIITQENSGRQLHVIITQSAFEVKYGIKFNEDIFLEGVTNSLWFENTGGIQTLKITPVKTSNITASGYEEITNYHDIVLTNNNPWISVSLSNDKKEIEIIIESNYMSSVRTGTIYLGILEASGEQIRYIPVRCSQRSVASYLYIDDSTEEKSVVLCTVGKDAVTRKFQIKSNYSWVVSESSVPTWITLIGYTGERPSGTSSLTLGISENTNQSVREAEIQIVNKGGTTRTIRVSQISRSVYIDINNQASDQSFELGEDFGITSVTVDVTSNVNWFLDKCPQWIIPSIYDGGEDGKATTTKLTLSLLDNGGGDDVVSLSYYDERTSTIMALRKIRIVNGHVVFGRDSYALVQSPLSIEVSPDGGFVTINTFANVRVRPKFLKEYDSVTGNLEMIVGNPEEIYSGEPNPDPKKYTPLTFEISKNETQNPRILNFVVTTDKYYEIWEEEIQEGNLVVKSDYSVFTIYQPGNKEITPVVFSPEDVKSIEKSELNFWVYRDTGVTTSDGKLTSQTKDRVRETFKASKGQIILIDNEVSELYKSPKETPTSGDVLERVSMVRNEKLHHSWYIIREDGYFFANTGGVKLITPRQTSDYTCNPERSEFTITLLSVMNNCWDVYNETLPDWISLEKVSGTNDFDSLKVIVDENTKNESRSFVLQFYVDSVDRSIKSFEINQSNQEIVYGEEIIESILPIVSSGKTAFTNESFDIGLSALIGCSSYINVNDEKKTYTYSKYVYSGVEFEVSSSDSSEIIEITEDSFGKPRLVVPKNNTPEVRSITIKATYDGISGELTLLQGSSGKISFYTYSDLRIEPDFGTIPTGISEIGFKILGKETLNTLDFGNGSKTGVTSEEKELEFPFLLENFKINTCGFNLISPDTLGFSGSIKDDVIVYYPNTEYSWNEETGKPQEYVSFVKTSRYEFKIGTDDEIINVGETLLSGNTPGKTLSTVLSFTKFREVGITRKDSSADVVSYMTPNFTGETAHSETEISVKLSNPLTEYLENKIITYQISVEGKILKYLHFRYLRSLPEIRCTVKSSVGDNDRQIRAEIGVSSNIGYQASSWDNKNYNTSIINGKIQTSESRLEDTRTIIYTSTSRSGRCWVSNYSTQSLILRDSDSYGILKEVPLIMGKSYSYQEGSRPGIQIVYNEKVISSFNDSLSDVYNLYLPYNGGSSKFQITCYDGLEISTETRFIRLTDPRTSIQKKIGSLKEIEIGVDVDSSNNSTVSVFRGSVKFKTSNRTFMINVYQSAMSGITKITDPKSKTIVLSKDPIPVTFSHSYSGWQILPYTCDIGSYQVLPKIDGKSFNNTFGSGNNSGIDNSGMTTVLFDYGDTDLHQYTNDSLEMKSISECTPVRSITPDAFGFKTAPADLFQTSSSTVKFSDSLLVSVRPSSPKYIIYEYSSSHLIQIADPFFIHVSNIRQNSSSGSYDNYSGDLDFYVYSDIFDRTEKYIGKNVCLNGETFKVYNWYDIYSRLLVSITGQVSNSEEILTSDEPTEGFFYSPVCKNFITDYVIIDGKKYARHTGSVVFPKGYGENTLLSRIYLTMDDFVVDESLYKGVTLVKRIPSIGSNFSY